MSEENPYSGEQSIVSQEPIVRIDDPTLRIMRSLAALGVVFGTLALISMPFGLLRLHEGDITGDARATYYDAAIRSTSSDAYGLFCSSVLGTGLGLMLFCGSVGALSFHRWARPLLLMWAIGSIVVGCGGSYFYLRWLYSQLREQFTEVRGVIDLMVTFAGWGIGTILAIAMLVLLTRGPVKAAFGV